MKRLKVYFAYDSNHSYTWDMKKFTIERKIRMSSDFSIS